ncbi:hypothetical protein D3C74_369140 [compost metagenome]
MLIVFLTRLFHGLLVEQIDIFLRKSDPFHSGRPDMYDPFPTQISHRTKPPGRFNGLLHTMQYLAFKLWLRVHSLLIQTFPYGLGFNCSDRHALAMDRIEAAKCIAKYE